MRPHWNRAGKTLTEPKCGASKAKHHGHRLPRFAVKMNLVDVGLLRDAETVAAIGAEIRASGRLLICHGCRDVEALITGLLVPAGDKEAWALCGACMGKLPIFGAVV